MIFAAILAGGVGRRMNMPDMPKQFLQLDGKPIIIHTIEKFLKCEKVDRVYVGVHADWIPYMKELIQEHITEDVACVDVVPGGADRNGTIFNIVDEIEGAYGVSDEHIIVTHDAVRPFVTLEIIENNIEAAMRYGATDTVVPATDTIVASMDGVVIHDIPNRANMYQGQTPQSFKINILKELYHALTDAEKRILTDACKICVVRNYPVRLVEGSVTNMKITTAGDYAIAQAMADYLK